MRRKIMAKSAVIMELAGTKNGTGTETETGTENQMGGAAMDHGVDEVIIASSAGPTEK